MVKANEQLWTDEEVLGMDATYHTLRRMRTAATMIEPTLFLRMGRTINNLLGGQARIYSKQEALLQAEELANAAGDFFAAKLSKTTHDKKEFEKWQDLLSVAQRQYELYQEATFSKAALKNAVGDSLLGRMRNLHVDPRYMLEWDLLENNNLGVETIKELINQDIGIISPLSGDYLLSKIYSSYLKHTRGDSFSVRAVALSEDLSRLVLPLDKEGNLPFENKKTIGIFIDTTATGNTARVLFEILQEAYPQKIISEPTFKTSEFTKSKKLKKYYGKN